MGDDPVRRDPVLSELRRLKPHHLVLTLADDDERKVVVPQKGARWRKLGDILDSQPWVSLDAFDASDNLLGTVEAPEGDDDEEGDDDAAVEEDGRDERMARVMSKLVTDTMAATASMFQAQIAGNSATIAAMTEGMRSVTETYQQSLRVQAATQAASAVDGDSDATKQVLGMLAAFMMQGSRQQQPSIPAESKERNRGE
jgi:hypothetical protein